MLQSFFVTLDKFFSNRFNLGFMAVALIIIGALILMTLKCTHYRRAKLIKDIVDDSNLRSSYIITLIGIAVNSIFVLGCGAKSKDIVQLIITNCVFLSLLYFNKHSLEQLKSLKEICFNFFHYLGNTCLLGGITFGIIANLIQANISFNTIIANLVVGILSVITIIFASEAINFLLLLFVVGIMKLRENT